MKRIVWLLVVLLGLAGLAPSAFAKTHKDMFSVPCNTLWKAVKDAVRNSGKYGIVAVDNEEMTISYNIGGTLGGKRLNEIVLNRSGEHQCEMQTQSAYSGMIHNDAGDMKSRVENSLAKIQAGTEKAALKEPMESHLAEVKNGQTVDEVEGLMGKPQDVVELKDSAVYIYPSVKIVFEKGHVTDIQRRESASK